MQMKYSRKNIQMDNKILHLYSLIKQVFPKNINLREMVPLKMNLIEMVHSNMKLRKIVPLNMNLIEMAP